MARTWASTAEQSSISLFFHCIKYHSYKWLFTHIFEEKLHYTYDPPKNNLSTRGLKQYTLRSIAKTLEKKRDQKPILDLELLIKWFIGSLVFKRDNRQIETTVLFLDQPTYKDQEQVEHPILGWHDGLNPFAFGCCKWVQSVLLLRFSGVIRLWSNIIDPDT